MDNDDQSFMRAAAKVAEKSLCLRDQCGSVIVNNGQIIGAGYNAPPRDDVSQRTCDVAWDLTKKPKFDKTCCIHAEWRAILDALRRNPDKIQGSSLYFMRLDPAGKMTRAGQPYCTVCSRLALDTGIAEFALWHEDGIRSYPTDAYNRLSYKYYSKVP